MKTFVALLAVLSVLIPSSVFGCISSSSLSSTASTTTLEKIITSWIKCNGTNYNGITGNVRGVWYNTTHIFTNAASVPDYSIGPWTANPNTPSDQNYTIMYPRTVTKATSKTKVGLGHIGQWSNGVSIYNPDDGMSYNSLGFWTRNAYFWEGVSFDSCWGHAAQNGEYHNHVFPRCMFSNITNTTHSTIVGFAFDGVPIYGPYGYSNGNSSTSGIVRIKTSYKLRSITSRTSYSNGTTLTGNQVGPTINATYPLGAYLEDFEYSAGHGHLDEYNGRFGVTPEFPDGVYAYFATIDSTGIPEYPFAVGPYYYGVPQLTGNTGPNSGKNSVPASASKFFTCTSTSYSGALSLYSFSLFNGLIMILMAVFVF